VPSTPQKSIPRSTDADSALDEAFTWYATAAAIYLVITLITQRAVKVIDKKFTVQGLSAPQGATA
jgi:arginine transport system permease protein